MLDVVTADDLRAVVEALADARDARHGIPRETTAEDVAELPSRIVVRLVSRLQRMATACGVTLDEAAQQGARAWCFGRPGKAEFLVHTKHPVARFVEDLDWIAAKLTARKRVRVRGGVADDAAETPPPRVDLADGWREVAKAIGPKKAKPRAA